MDRLEGGYKSLKGFDLLADEQTFQSGYQGRKRGCI